MKLIRAIGAYTLITLWVSGCATYSDQMTEVRGLYRSGNCSEAEKKISSSNLATASTVTLLYQLETAVIKDRCQQRDESRKLLMSSDKLVDKLYTLSVSKEALTYVYNDTAQEYSGEDYEKVAIHTMLALSFLEDQSFKEARVEARRINTRLDEINQKYDEKTKNRYREDAYALFLSGLIYEALDEPDSAIIDYRHSIKTYQNLYTKEFGIHTPQTLIRSLARVLRRRNRNEELKKLQQEFAQQTNDDFSRLPKPNEIDVMVLHEDGTVAPKEPKNFFIPFGRQVIRLAFPVIYPRSMSTSVNVSLSVGTQHASGSAELFQNMDRIAEKTLDDRRLRLVVKQGARLLVKGQITEQAYQHFGPLGGLAANVYSAVSENADTRSWTLLPANFYATQFRLQRPTGVTPPEIKVTVGSKEFIIGKADWTKRLVVLRTKV